MDLKPVDLICLKERDVMIEHKNQVKSKQAVQISTRWMKRGLLHLCILLGAVSIVIEKTPLWKSSSETAQVVEVDQSSDQLLAEAISTSQKKPSVLKSQNKMETKPSASDPIETFEELTQLKLSARKSQLLNSFVSDKLALWSVFANLSTYTGLMEILSQPIQAFERETLRSQSFGISSGFDQIIYRIHLESGGTSLVTAQVEKDSVFVSLYISPSEMGEAYRIQKFKDGVWLESKEMMRAQVDEEFLKMKNGSSVVLSASVGL